MPTNPAPLSAPKMRGLGILVLGLTGAVYAMALSTGQWPMGHPWSGLNQTLLGSFLVLQGSKLFASLPKNVVMLWRILIFASALLWLTMAILKILRG